jgi:hypothetical protein
MYLAVNRWVYDATRGLPIDCKNPQKARDVTSMKNAARTLNVNDTPISVLGSQFNDGRSVRSVSVLTLEQQRQ